MFNWPLEVNCRHAHSYIHPHICLSQKAGTHINTLNTHTEKYTDTHPLNVIIHALMMQNVSEIDGMCIYLMCMCVHMCVEVEVAGSIMWGCVLTCHLSGLCVCCVISVSARVGGSVTLKLHQPSP